MLPPSALSRIGKAIWELAGNRLGALLSPFSSYRYHRCHSAILPWTGENIAIFSCAFNFVTHKGRFCPSTEINGRKVSSWSACSTNGLHFLQGLRGMGPPHIFFKTARENGSLGL